MHRTRLTAFKVENIKPDPNKRLEIPDAGKPGLYLVVQTNGRKSWAVRYRRLSDRRPCKLTLEGFPSLATAHKLAQDALDKVAQGEDPAAAKQVAKRTPVTNGEIDAAFRLFLDKHVRTRAGRPIRESTRRETARLLGYRRDPKDPTAWVATGNGVLKRWGKKTLPSIKPFEVRDLLDDLAKTGPVMANRTLSALKTCFSFHMRRDPDLMVKSPCDGVDEPSAEQGGRDRTLTDRELAALWRVADTMGYPYGRMVQVLILTGCRRDEVREAPWAEFDMTAREWLIPGRRSKNGRDHLLPITDTLADILEKLPRIKGKGFLFTTTGDTAISGLSKIKKRLEKALTKELDEEPERWTLHDLRRTFVTGLQRLRFPLEVAEACVNHASGSTSGVTGVYARHAYTTEKREALTAWAQHVIAISLTE